ncbi:MAG: xanthine dehydrogenase small subunit [Candidatus Tectomicrobia bacterium]|nr:xanthine dehydrogenase small subunit [Candidatus Tectomicrobia bacterium]
MASQTPAERDVIRFVLDGEVIELRDIDPTLTVLQYLRESRRRTGTKEGCAEGDCGACTVVLGELHGPHLRFRTVNACIQFVPTLDSKALITVESLKTRDGRLHPVQQAMVECHASQCGFCTPGFVMSLYALYKTESAPTHNDIQDALAGNLCRCTGYRPIIDAAQRMYHLGHAEDPTSADDDMIDQLRFIQHRHPIALRRHRLYFAPTTIDGLTALLQRYPEAHLLAGGTDMGVWVTKQYQHLDVIIYIGRVEPLTQLKATHDAIEVGAAVPLTDVYDTLRQHYPMLDELWRRFASPPIRNVATLGGNIANASPIGDSMPILIALGTTLILRHGAEQRECPLDDFYMGYRHTTLKPGELIERIRIPRPAPDQHIHAYKVAKRYDQDISAVCGAYCLTLEDNIVRDIRICYGGMAATPQRAEHCEQSLIGQTWTESAVDAAAAELDQDYTPLSDMRASATYRRLVAQNLLRRFFMETSNPTHMTRTSDFSLLQRPSQ